MSMKNILSQNVGYIYVLNCFTPNVIITGHRLFSYHPNPIKPDLGYKFISRCYEGCIWKSWIFSSITLAIHLSVHCNDQLQRYRWRHRNKSSNVLHRTGKRQRLGAPRARYNNHDTVSVASSISLRRNGEICKSFIHFFSCHCICIARHHHPPIHARPLRTAIK